jgi:long-subunit fatty acid transport protein
MIKRACPLLLLFILLAGNAVHAQVNDAQLWMSAAVEKRLTPALSIEFQEEIRMVENMTEIGTIYSDLGISYRFMKKFKAGVAYRFALKRRLDDTYERFNSWYVEGTYREKIKPIVLALRVKYQSKYAEAFTSEKSYLAKNHLRTKLTIKYDLQKKYEPYVYAETYFQARGPSGEMFDQLKLCAGVEYEINRMHALDLHYLFCREFNEKNPETDYVIGVGYSYSF